MSTDLAIPLHELTEVRAPRAGGKGANLGRLLRLGLPVPPGFVVTTDAYHAFIAASNLRGTASGQAREHIAAAPIPEEIGAAIRVAYRRLAAPAVAVRSSGTAEDLASA